MRLGGLSSGPVAKDRLTRISQCAVKSHESPVGEIINHPGTNAPPGTTWRVDGGDKIDQALQERAVRAAQEVFRP